MRMTCRNFPIKISKVSLSYSIIWLILFVFFFHRFFIQLGAPDGIKSILDVLNVTLFLLAINKNVKLSNTEKKYILCYMFFGILGTASALINVPVWGWNIIPYFLDCRAILRFVLFLYSCKRLLTQYMVNKLINWILGFHVINSLYIVYQYFTLKVDIYWMRGDNLNGFFGIATGGNIYVNVMLIAVTILIVSRWINKLCNKRLLLFFLGLNLVIATLTEIKAYYIEIIIILAVFATPYLRKITKKQLIIGGCVLFGGIWALLFLVHLLYKIYPWMEGTMSSISALIKAGSSNESIGDIGRVTFLSDTYKKIFHYDLIDTIMGVGIGSANLNGGMTKLANTYADLTHYSWISSSYILIENGIVGLLLYIYSFFILISGSKKKETRMFAIASFVLAVFLILYNETFRTEAGYIMFLLISFADINNSHQANVLLRNGVEDD